MKGKYISPEAYSLPASRGMNDDAETGSSVDASTLKKSTPKATEDEKTGSLAPTVNADKKALPASANSGGSLDPTPAAKPAQKGLDQGGSVADPQNKSAVAPVE